MEENKIVERINEEAVNQICEEVSISNHTMLKLGVGAAVATAAGYGIYRLVKKIKNRKQEAEYVESEEVFEEKSK